MLLMVFSYTSSDSGCSWSGIENRPFGMKPALTPECHPVPKYEPTPEYQVPAPSLSLLSKTTSHLRTPQALLHVCALVFGVLIVPLPLPV